MIVKNIQNLPAGTKSVALYWGGDGNPANDHELLGIAFLDKDDREILRVGNILDFAVDKVDDCRFVH